MPAPIGVVASSRHDASGGGVPATIPGLVMWLDADDAATFGYSSGSVVSAWHDKTVGAEYPYFYNSDVARQPTRTIDALIAGRYATTWVDDRLHAPRTPNTKPFTAFAVVKPTTDAVYKAIMGSNDAGGMEWRLTNTHRQSLVQEYVAEIGVSTTALPTTTASVICVSYSATGQYHFYINGSLDGTATNDKAFNAAAWLTVGDAIGEPFKGAVGELIKYNRVLTDAERNTLFVYLSQRWRGGYLDGSVGMATTPDPGTLPLDHVFVAKILGPANPLTAGDMAAQHDGSTSNSSWGFQRYDSGSEHRLRTAIITAAGGSGTRYCAGPIISGAVDYVALANRNSGANWQATTYGSADEGKTWTQIATRNAGAIDPLKDSSMVVSIGSRSNRTSIFAGRVYWVELRTGLDPAGGTVVWRFDANEHTAGTTWTDPRGRVWTLSTAAAIVH